MNTHENQVRQGRTVACAFGSTRDKAVEAACFVAEEFVFEHFGAVNRRPGEFQAGFQAVMKRRAREQTRRTRTFMNFVEFPHVRMRVEKNGRRWTVFVVADAAAKAKTVCSACGK